MFREHQIIRLYLMGRSKAIKRSKGGQDSCFRPFRKNSEKQGDVSVPYSSRAGPHVSIVIHQCVTENDALARRFVDVPGGRTRR